MDYLVNVFGGHNKVKSSRNKLGGILFHCHLTGGARGAPKKVFQALLVFLSNYWFLLIYRLVGDVLLATGFLSYSGPFNQTFRTRLRTNWQSELKSKRIPYTEDLNITAMLVDNATVSNQ